MRIIAYSRLKDYWTLHPDAEVGLVRWFDTTREADWQSIEDVVRHIGGAKALNGERVRFAIRGGSHRLIASFDFRRGVVYLKFIGTHADYDRVDALTVAQF